MKNKDDKTNTSYNNINSHKSSNFKRNIKGLANISTVNCGSVESYISSIKKIPLLSVEKEKQLTQALYKHEDIKAAQELILSHLRFVVHISKKYSGYGLQEADLIQEGNIGLMKATKRFNPDVGVRFATYAVYWIKAEIHEFVLKNWKIVKLATSKAQRKLFFNIRKNKKQLGWFSPEEVTKVAKKLNVTEKDVIEMESRLSNRDQPFDHSNTDNHEEALASSSPSLYLEDSSSNTANNVEHENWTGARKNLLNRGLNTLDKRSQDIIKDRWLSETKITLKALADRYQVSAERIRQIEDNAITKLRGVMAA